MKVPSTNFRRFEDDRQALEYAAALWGIEPGYWDIWGNRHETSPETCRSILESMGIRASSLEELNDAIGARLWRDWTSLCPPVLVISESSAPALIPLRIPAEMDQRHVVRAELEHADGARESSEHSLEELEITGRAELRERRFVERPLSLPSIPVGENRLRVSVRGPDGHCLQAETILIVTPDRAYRPPELENGGRRAGLYVSLYGIRSTRNWGCGDFSDLERLSAWVAKRIGGSFVALNPLHAIHNRQPFNTSPYLPNCIFYQNPIYLDIEKVHDFQMSSWARALRNSPPVIREIESLRDAEFVEYERVHRLKLGFLRLAFRTFLREYRTGTPRALEFRAFVEHEGLLLERYAVYCALDEWIHQRDPKTWTWTEWPEHYQDPGSVATAEFARRHWRRVLFYKYVQWQVDCQLAEAQTTAREQGLSIGLLHDLALATDSRGSDLWAHRDYFVAGCRVGAPPDDFSPKGQDWAFPPPSSARHWEDAYRLFREMIRKSCRHGGALRIDHVMRFFRLFWIPAGKEATDGTYVRDRHEDLIRILALESVRNKVVIVGEDLGTVDPATRRTLAEFGILSYRLFYFEKNDEGELRSPEEFPEQALVSSTTHDLPTLAGFWTGRDIEARRAAGVLPDGEAYQGAVGQRRYEKQKMLESLHRLKFLSGSASRRVEDYPELTGELHNAIIGFLASTPSMLLALNQEDLTKETEQQNLPGTTAQYPNWRRKMRYSIEELESAESLGGFVDMFRNWLAKTGRLAD